MVNEEQKLFFREIQSLFNHKTKEPVFLQIVFIDEIATCGNR